MLNARRMPIAMKIADTHVIISSHSSYSGVEHKCAVVCSDASDCASLPIISKCMISQWIILLGGVDN